MKNRLTAMQVFWKIQQKAAFEAGYTVGFARTLHDIDEKEDISKFRNRMRKTLELQKSETGRYLRKKTEDFCYCSDL